VFPPPPEADALTRTSPVIDPTTKRAVNVLKRSRAFILATGNHSFDIPVSQLLQQHQGGGGGGSTAVACPGDLTLFQAFVKFAETKMECLCLVSNDSLVGVCHLTQLLDYFVR
jgi:hypothetical protein